jgi:glycosyltransferase involved in cell wall biosynthesis
MARKRLLLVLEDTRGNAVHALHLERAARQRHGIDVVVAHIRFGATARRHAPVVGNWSARAGWKARRLIRRELRSARRPDAILIHTQVPSLLSVPFMREVPTVISVDATPLNFDSVGLAYGHRRGPLPLEYLKWVLNRRAFHAATAVVAFSHWAAGSVVQDYRVPAARVHVIRPGVDLSLFQPDSTGRERARPRILFVGDDFQRKGGDDLLAAMAPLAGEVELDLVTHSSVPPMPAGLTVRMHRDLQPESPALVDRFRAADIFVLPSRGECYGHVIVEAMACGLPVISTSVGAVQELVCDGLNGFLVPPESPPALAAAIRRLVMNPDLRARMGAAGLSLARRGHDCADNAESVLDLLEGAAERAVAA